MTSVNTNASATTALRTLQATNKALETTQNRISTGLKIGEAKDNAAYWSISTTLKSDNKSLATVKDALGLGAATVDTAYQGLNKAKEVLDEIQKKLTAATGAGVNKDTIQQEIGELQEQLKSIASSSVFSGENWLSIDSSAPGYDALKNVVASFSRDSNNAVTIGTIQVDASAVALFDGSTDAAKAGIVDAALALKDAQGNDLSFGGIAMAGNKDAGGFAATAATGTDAVKAKSVFTGAFTATTLDADDELTLSFKADNAASASTIKIKVGDVAGAGIATAGTIGSVDELALVVNNILKSNGINDVAAIKDGNGFALQRTSGGLNKTIEVTTFTGADSAFTNSVTATGVTGTAATAYTAQADTLTFIANTAGTAGDLTVTLATGETKTFANLIGAGATANAITAAVTSAINGASELNGQVTAVDTGSGVVTLTYKTAGAKGTLVATETASVTTLAVGSAATPYAANSATVSSVIGGSASAVFKDADDKILFKFQDSLVGGGTTQTVEITKADLETAGVTDLDIDDGTDLRLALAAAFTRQAATNSVFANYNITSASGTDLTLTRKGPGVAGQTLTIVSGLTALDPSPTITNTFGLTAVSGVKQGVNAAAASAASTLSLPAGGITLDSDDNISFAVTVGTGAATTVKIDQALINSTLAGSTKAKAVAGTFDVAGLKTSDSVSFTVDWNGVASTYKVTNLSENSSINDVVTAINGATAIAGAAGTFSSKGTASIENGKIVFSALTAGSANSVKVYDIGGTNAYGGKFGLQASGLVFGENAIVANGTISTASQYARVVNAALGTAGVAGVLASASGGGISIASTNTGASASVATSNVVASSGANKISLDAIDISTAALAATGATTSDQVKTVLSAYIGLVSQAITKVTAAAANLGSVASRIDMQTTFVDTLMDTIDKGVGNLIDADLSEESTRLQALQTKQQLGVQALSIANASTQNILRLFQ